MPRTIVLRSGGQSGADRAALEVAVARWRLVDIDSEPGAEPIAWLSAFLREESRAPFDLNVAGPRESEVPGIRDRAAAYLHVLLRVVQDS